MKLGRWSDTLSPRPTRSLVAGQMCQQRPKAWLARCTYTPCHQDVHEAWSLVRCVSTKLGRWSDVHTHPVSKTHMKPGCCMVRCTYPHEARSLGRCTHHPSQQDLHGACMVTGQMCQQSHGDWSLDRLSAKTGTKLAWSLVRYTPCQQDPHKALSLVKFDSKDPHEAWSLVRCTYTPCQQDLHKGLNVSAKTRT